MRPVSKLITLAFTLVLSAPVTTIGRSTLKVKDDTALRSKVDKWVQNSAISFIENKGQMVDMNANELNNLLFKVTSGGVDMYITTTGISYVFTKIEKRTENKQHLRIKVNDTNSITEHYSRADMDLVGARIRIENIITEGESEDKTDYYFGGHYANGVLNVHGYKRITMKNIYPGIDWVLYINGKGLKYDFVVHPNADYKLIKLKYKWTDKPEINNDGSVQINTPMGKIIEGAPVSYLLGMNDKIKTTYEVNENEISFSLSNYSNNQTLIIDPTLIWATFYGGNQQEQGYSISSDGTNVWVAGTAVSANFPIYNPSGGAYFQGTTGGNNDAFILKFSTSGVRKWGTFYGGNKGAEAISVNSDGTNVWVTGFTGSSNLPTLNPGGGAYYQNTLTGKANAFILQFDTACVMKWATYYGGNTDDYALSVNSDGTNVWVTGYTNSTNFPTLNPGGGAYYQNTNADSMDVFILQFSKTGVCKWATYYGGNCSDYGQSISSDGTNVWVTGYTNSTNLPTKNPAGGAYYQSANAGGIDAFILQFNTSGVCKWGTYYGGSGSDYSYSINSDGANVWLTGATTSTNFPLLDAGGGAYFQDSNIHRGGTFIPDDIFILKLNTSGVRKWCTYYGGYAEQYGYSINSDGAHVWVTGYTSTQNFGNGYPWFYLLNPGGGSFFEEQNFGGIYPGGYNVFILEFSTLCVCEWSTYYSINGGNQGNSIQSDGTNVWLTGAASHGAAGMPTLNPGGGAYYQDSIDSLLYHWNTNTAFIGKFTACSPLDVTVLPKPANICKGDSIMLQASGGNSYIWFPSTSLNNDTLANPTAKPDTTTTYFIKYTSGKCKSTDTITLTVIPLPTVGPSQVICRGSNIDLSATGGNLYLWSPSITLNNDTISDPTAKPSGTTTYSVTITNKGCSVKDSVTITVNPLPVVTVCCNATINAGQSASITVTPSPTNYTYNWQPTEGLSCTNCANLIASPFSTTTYSVTVTDSLGCDTVGYVTIDVNCGAFVPDAFSPNGDGQNDVLYVRGDCIKTIDFVIFDRWGNRVFETTDKNIGWNGSYKGEPMNTGSYAYYLTGTKYDGTSIEKKGNITLMR